MFNIFIYICKQDFYMFLKMKIFTFAYVNKTICYNLYELLEQWEN